MVQWANNPTVPDRNNRYFTLPLKFNTSSYSVSQVSTDGYQTDTSFDPYDCWIEGKSTTRFKIVDGGVRTSISSNFIIIGW